MADLVELTMVEAGRLVANRSVSVQELVGATLERIAETEPAVHAYAHVADGAALATASRLDADLKAGRHRGPLHGITVGVKDLCYTVDMPTEAGSRVLAGFVPPTDAEVVTRLRDAGAVIVGKTVTHEFAYGQNVPPTRNPWDTRCYPGGSSAGSGVSVAVRSAFASIGTDTGGSIRIPAALNGVVGLKPTFGRVSAYGVIPLSPSLDHVGPLARTVEDCALVLDALAGSGTRASFTASLEKGVEGAVIGVERDFLFGETVDEEVRGAVESAIDALREEGARVVEVTLPELRLMPLVALSILLIEASAQHRQRLREQRDEYEVGTRLVLELGELLPASHYAIAGRARKRLQGAVKAAYDRSGLDALIAPTTPKTTVPLPDLDVGLIPNPKARMTLAAYVDPCFPANLTGQPALSIPCGFSADGLPIGFQLIGRPFEEHVLLQVGRAYERGHEWHRLGPTIHSH
jgi:aspartyl-tRNA(Asn)/glutamyl-tRNA(Gln) amidotransferase subunit A